ncbi:ER lumen protein-retaining receptor 2 [Alligator sinensis]|uniref:ER lumen protein-retaining receptor n=1 Tax=Alligator sinensis TaxID=38654 RepID=A0A1U7S5Z2_ALLSI|nr:ER lumen protein-retaining receptor 2 [Alligator sinensis]
MGFNPDTLADTKPRQKSSDLWEHVRKTAFLDPDIWSFPKNRAPCLPRVSVVAIPTTNEHHLFSFFFFFLIFCIIIISFIALGISGKSQLLFALVFTTRYLDLFTSFISLYNTSMKLIYIGCSYATVYLIYMKFKATYDGNHDTFRVEFLVVPVGGLSFLVNHDFSPLEILWTFSIYLESVAILPQLFMISKTGEAETITTHYLFFLGLYRALYLINWIWRYYFEGFFDLIAVVAGVVQTILYCDFFYLYVTKVLKGKKLSLPA